MAIVADLSTNSPLDKSFATHNRTNAGSPENSVTPQYAGEIILDTTNGRYYKAMSTTNSSWIALTPA